MSDVTFITLRWLDVGSKKVGVVCGEIGTGRQTNCVISFAKVEFIFLVEKHAFG